MPDPLGAYYQQPRRNASFLPQRTTLLEPQRERMLSKTAGTLGAFGRNVLAPTLRDIAYGVAPVTGEALAARDLLRAGGRFQQGLRDRNPFDLAVGGLDYATAGLGMLPLVGYGPRAAKALARAPGKFYSRLMESVADAPQAKMSPEQWAGYLRKPERARPAETAAVNLDDILRQRAQQSPGPLFEHAGVKAPPMTKGELLDKLDVNQVRVDELELGAPGQPGTKWGQFQRVPGGEDYRELLLTIPDQRNQELVDELAELRELTSGFPETIGRDKPFQRNFLPVARRGLGHDDPDYGGFNQKLDAAALDRAEIRIDEIQRELTGSNYEGGHFSGQSPNVFVHVRFDSRDGDIGRQLFIHEIQSDWHSAARKGGGFRSDPLPDEPVMPELRVRQTAPGPQGEPPRWIAEDPETGEIWANSQSQDNLGALMEETYQSKHDVWEESVADLKKSRLPDLPFKQNYNEVALKRMIKYAADNGFDEIVWPSGEIKARHSGRGGEGAKGYEDLYDRIMVKNANKIGKRFGAKVEKIESEIAGEGGFEVFDQHGGGRMTDEIFETSDAAYDWIRENQEFGIQETWNALDSNGTIIGRFPSYDEAQDAVPRGDVKKAWRVEGKIYDDHDEAQEAISQTDLFLENKDIEPENVWQAFDADDDLIDTFDTEGGAFEAMDEGSGFVPEEPMHQLSVEDDTIDQSFSTREDAFDYYLENYEWHITETEGDLVSGTAHRLELTPELVEEAKKGFPLFQIAGGLLGTGAAAQMTKRELESRGLLQ